MRLVIIEKSGRKIRFEIIANHSRRSPEDILTEMGKLEEDERVVDWTDIETERPELIHIHPKSVQAICEAALILASHYPSIMNNVQPASRAIAGALLASRIGRS